MFPQVLLLLWTAALAGFFNTILSFYLAQELHFDFVFDRKRFQDFFLAGLSFWLANVSWMLYLKIDVVVLSLLSRPENELGWYQAAIRFYELGLLIAYLVSSVLLPILSNPEQVRLSSSRLSYYLSSMAVLGGGLSGLGILSSGYVLPLFLGDNYTNSAGILSILLLALPYVFMSLLWFTILGAKDLQYLVARAASLCLLLNVCLNFYLIPRFGYTGAAWATVAADFGLWVFLVIFAYQKDYFLSFQIMIASLLWFPIALWLRYLSQNKQIVMASCLFMGLLALLLSQLWLQKRSLDLDKRDA